MRRKLWDIVRFHTYRGLFELVESVSRHSGSRELESLPVHVGAYISLYFQVAGSGWNVSSTVRDCERT